MFLYYTPSRGELYILHSSCADPESFFRWNPTLTTFCFLAEGIQIPQKAGHHLPASKTPFQCDYSGDLDQNCKETLNLCDVSGGSGPHVIPLWIRACSLCPRTKKYTRSELYPNCPHSFLVSNDFCCLLITFTNSLDPYQYRQIVRPDLDTDPLTL